MSFVAHAEAPPLREDADGALRVGQSRVLFELVIQAFQDGATPETIVLQFTTLRLSDVYAVIAYYLRHKADVEAYLAERETKSAEMAELLAPFQADLTEIRARLLARNNG